MYDCVIIGAGPAGLMAAIKASEKYKVLVIEKNSKPGKKLLITGGGRCNVTNLKSNDEFLNEINYNKKYLYSAINTFGPKEIVEFFYNNGVPLKEENNNKMFPESNKAIDILKALLKCTKKVEFKYEEIVTKIKPGEITTNKGIYKTKNIIIATGGSSFKETGSTGDNMKFAKMINQPTTNLFPAETGIVIKERPDLAGTTFEDIIISFDKRVFNGNLMFTHNGLSGEVIMKASEHIFNEHIMNINVDFLPKYSNEELLNSLNNFDREKEFASWLNNFFTKRFSNYIVQKLSINKKIKQLALSDKKLIVSMLKEMMYEVVSVMPLEKAYVTGGGIDMRYIDTTTMESKINKGIYFVGEALDIHGPIGGYNITLALATGYLAGSKIHVI